MVKTRRVKPRNELKSRGIHHGTAMAGDVGWEWENEFPVDVLMVLRTEK
jgi:hypothetical protein